MLFNVNKCKVMHIGKQNQQRQYFMHDQCLEVVCQEKDLGILISNDLKVSQQCQQTYNKASRIFGLINRTIEYKHTDILLRLYKCLVRPHLEYCIVSWSPHYKKDNILIERIKKWFTRMILSIKEFPYEVRLKKLGLWSWKTDVSEPISSKYSRLYMDYPQLTSAHFANILNMEKQDRHPLKLYENRVRTDLRQHFFSERVNNTWNKLDSDIVCKNHLERLHKDESFIGLFRSA